MQTTKEIVTSAKEMMMEYGAVVNEQVLIKYLNVLLSTAYDKLTTNSDLYYEYVPCTLKAGDDTLDIPVPSFNNRVDKILLNYKGNTGTIKKVNSFLLAHEILGGANRSLPTAWCQMPSMKTASIRITPCITDVELVVVLIPERPRLGLPIGKVAHVELLEDRTKLLLTTPVGNAYFQHDSMETIDWVTVTSLEGKNLGTWLLEGKPQGSDQESTNEPETLTLLTEVAEQPRYSYERISPLEDTATIQPGDYLTRGGLVAGTYLGDTVDNFLILGLVATLKDSLLEGTKIIGAQADSYFRDLSAQSRGRDNASRVVRSYRYTDSRGVR